MPSLIPASERAAYLVRVTGLVQGVGFRPFVHRLAQRHRLAGWVRNATGDVQIAVEGEASGIEAFLSELAAEAPPLARIEKLSLEAARPQGLAEFRVVASSEAVTGRLPVSPDVGLCAACEAELFDPANRRYRYPFITCPDCGPRYTVIDALPYDRERTSMAVFVECEACSREHHDPADRRYHSQTNSCPDCGPTLRFGTGAQHWLHEPEAALLAAVRLLLSGRILAVRGLGGFHLAVDATSDQAVARLRQRKNREAKPLAVMVRSLAEAHRIAELSTGEAALLAAPERPIVLVTPRADAGLAASVAPGLDRIGLMLAYTPLHQLLCHDVGRPLVMTSGNRSDEPIVTRNEAALTGLAPVADGFLLHDREIVARYDDSVLRAGPQGPLFLRRARGFAPLPLELPVASPQPLIAVGPHLKNTFCLVDGCTAFVSQHIGDLETVETLEHFHDTLTAYRTLFRIDPQVAVRDAHPGYLSSQVAGELGLERVIPVQHHHAHIAAVLAEHGMTEPVIGLALDGTGYGDDGTVWGAEVLLADLRGYRRAANLLPVPLPGGDLAARTPWRAALGYLSAEPGLAPAFAEAFEGVAPTELAVARRQIEARLHAPLASSMGRLFDTAAAVLGVRRESRYEGQAAMELEALAGRRPATEYPCRFLEQDGRIVLDPLPLLAELGSRRRGGEPAADLAADFHASIAWALGELVRQVAIQSGLTTVAFGGGVFQNARLLEALEQRLVADGFRVLTPRRLSPNDGAISYGQAAVAAAMLAAEQGG